MNYIVVVFVGIIIGISIQDVKWVTENFGNIFLAFSVIWGVYAYNKKESIRKEDEKPSMVGYLKRHPENYFFYNLCINNVGGSPAYNVKFRFIFSEEYKEMGKKTIGHILEYEDKRVPMNVIPVGHTDEMKFCSASWYIDNEQVSVPPFELVFEYEDKEGVKFEDRSIIDTRQYEGFHDLEDRKYKREKNIDNTSRSINVINF